MSFHANKILDPGSMGAAPGVPSFSYREKEHLANPRRASPAVSFSGLGPRLCSRRVPRGVVLGWGGVGVCVCWSSCTPAGGAADGLRSRVEAGWRGPDAQLDPRAEAWRPRHGSMPGAAPHDPSRRLVCWSKSPGWRPPASFFFALGSGRCGGLAGPYSSPGGFVQRAFLSF